MDEKLLRMREIIDQLNEASDAYYNGLSEKMTDYEWDALFDELKRIEEETGTVLDDSPTNNVSADNVAGQKEEHEFSALSLAKTKKISDLVKWAEGRPIWVSWKLDGLTLVVTYDNGKLNKIVTRGDGHIGTNITHLADGINGIPKKIEEKGHLVIRGEALISYDDFEDFCMTSDEEYANPRNLASGSLSLKDVEELKKRKLNWIPFSLVYSDTELNTFGEQMDYLVKQDFVPVDRELVQEPTEENIQDKIDLFTEKVVNHVNPYPVDGLVIAYDDIEYSKTGSVTGHHATKAGYAFKWADEAASTKLDYIEWSCAASTITPVAIFEPVELEGTTVKRASLCNISECERLGIGDRGTAISVIKANKIIPKVIKVNEKVGELTIPDVCPVCGAPTRIQISDASNTKTLKCTNADCAAKKLNRFSRFVSKQGCNIDGLSKQTIAKFVSKGWIKNNADIYRIGEHTDEIMEMEGFGEKSAQNIYNAIEKAREVTDLRLVYALNIPLVAQDVAKKLLANYTFEELMDISIKEEDPAFFGHIDGIGPEKSSAFINWFKDSNNVEMVKDLLHEIELLRSAPVATGGTMEGLVFVITGDVYQYKNRNELKAYIESQGGKVTGSVSGSTNFLINNDVNSTSGKNQKAKQLNIPIISEQDFIDRFVQ